MVARSMSVIAVQAATGRLVLGVRDRAQLVMLAYETGLVTPGRD